MIVDANLLLYAVDEDAQWHRQAKDFLERGLNGTSRVGLPAQSLGAFLRTSTHPRLWNEPLSASSAAAHIDDWLAAPAAWIPDVTKDTWAIVSKLVIDHQLTGNLIPDAQLAALAIQYGVPVASADSDFARFPAARWINPCG